MYPQNIAEGCSENLRPLLNFIVPFVLGSLKDPVKYVQGAGCFALSELGSRFQSRSFFFFFLKKNFFFLRE